MESAFKHYVCGFNGFRQIELLVSHAKTLKQSFSESTVNSKESTNSDEQNETRKLFFSVPQKIGEEIRLCTWSTIWSFTASGQIACYGNTSSPVITELQNEERDLAVSLVQTGNSTILQDSCNIVLIDETGAVVKVKQDVEHVGLVNGTQEYIYGLKDGQCFEGQVKETQEGQYDWRLYLHPITFNMEVKTVSCGFEHTLILTEKGAVYTYGNGSRGQLGHGEVTVDLLKVPRCVDTLSGISVVAIAAGGWHSVSVTDTGDVYVWGWNESGQLGIPSSTISTRGNLDHRNVQRSSNMDIDREAASTHPDRSKAGRHFITEAVFDNKMKSFELSGREIRTLQDVSIKNKIHHSILIEGKNKDCKRKFSDVVEENTELRCDRTHFETDNERKVTDVVEKNVKKIKNDYVNKRTTEQDSDLGNIKEDLDRNEVNNSFTSEEWNYCKDTEDSAYSKSDKLLSTNQSEFEGGNTDCKGLTFYQDLDSVQIQTVPYGLDLPDNIHVTTASCGTRHTCLLTDSGDLFTTGWNSYGQLCHGDTRGRDYLQIVTFFRRRNEKVIDVKAQCWNTYIITKNSDISVTK